MTYQPIVPFTGLAGWQFLQRTMDNQKTAFDQSVPVQRATDAFRDRIGSITSAAELVEDRQLLEVALGAFGLDDDINNKFYIRKILEEGSFDSGSLANRLSDKSYLAFTRIFGYGDIGGAGLTTRPGFADDIIQRFEDRQFEIAVGNQDNDMRLALNFPNELQDVVDQATSVDARWFSIMGSTPLRSVVETALGLPSGISQIDLDQQLSEFKDRAQRVLGTDDPAEFLNAESQEQIVRLFLVRSEAAAASSFSSASIAIALLQGVA